MFAVLKLKYKRLRCKHVMVVVWVDYPDRYVQNVCCKCGVCKYEDL